MDCADSIRSCFASERVFYSRHARIEMKQEAFGEIVEQEVYEAVMSSELLKEYPEDKPYPSLLLYGKTSAGRPLHIVCAYDAEEDSSIVITVYHPDPRIWMDCRVRREP